MCDTMIALPPSTKDGAIYFAKNSDREPGEAQLVEHVPKRTYAPGARLKTTYLDIPQARVTNEVLLSRPFWMWGAEMGASARGVVIGNEAVFTRIPVEDRGLLGMDLLRIALERATSARDAVDVITELLARHPQGGAAGYRNRAFKYHNGFLIADAAEAWVLETAGRFWAAERVRSGVRTLSNVLSIGASFDLIAKGAFELARAEGWCESASDFEFARAFGDPVRSMLSGGAARRACTARLLLGGHPGGSYRPEDRMSEMAGAGPIDEHALFETLRSHDGRDPSRGFRLSMPCAHASWQPLRQSGQTTGSMVSRLSGAGALHWLTGTSSPCISVFKPLVLGGGELVTSPVPGAGYDRESLFWRHESLHRSVLEDYETRAALIRARRDVLERRVIALRDVPSMQAAWNEHREEIPYWTDDVNRRARAGGGSPLFRAYWARQRRIEGMPVS